jgi:hypothetical protein
VCGLYVPLTGYRTPPMRCHSSATIRVVFFPESYLEFLRYQLVLGVFDAHLDDFLPS